MTTGNTRYLNICIVNRLRTEERLEDRIYILIFRVRGDKKLPEAFVPLGKGDDKRILILEISYTALGLMNARTEDKRRKYEDTLKGLREDGWEPELYTLVLGTLGEIPSTAVQVLEDMGVRGAELDRLTTNRRYTYDSCRPGGRMYTGGDFTS